ncbi:hypothetical protein O181_070421 [Austropuccinia psidii MF-1]|uniref:Retrovirus-related Pol polyprotein from transposon TNT 1-94-like beta-barrel domain-containing protein n=1 Tax=Austropuccinia psidii MF-1 TaxID=1389203 RepID=A0A9Q3F5D0_9BASI|nr:hypothetical protein [Austropuccinia psidii MF-1]
MTMSAGSRFSNNMQQQSSLAGNQQYVKKSIFTPPSGDGKYRRYPHTSTRSEVWARQWLSPEHPCIHCWEWGHWEQDCLRKRAGKLAAEDPIIKKPGLKLKKSQHVLHPALAGMEVNEDCYGNVASIERSPENDLLVLLDSGATHHVTNNQSIFLTYQPVNLTLLVATTDKHKVKGIGTIRLSTQDGDMSL